MNGVTSLLMCPLSLPAAGPLALAMDGREKEAQEAKARELPYVFACPSSYEVRVHERQVWMPC